MFTANVISQALFVGCDEVTQLTTEILFRWCTAAISVVSLDVACQIGWIRRVIARDFLQRGGRTVKHPGRMIGLASSRTRSPSLMCAETCPRIPARSRRSKEASKLRYVSGTCGGATGCSEFM